MEALPHQYCVKVTGKPENSFQTYADGLPTLDAAPPVQFDGPGDLWSPETLLMASVANCFALSFKAVAKASRFEWLSIECDSTGDLEKVDREIRFTNIVTRVRLVIPPAEDIENAEKLLNKSEKICLISNSLLCETHIEYEIVVGGE